MIKKTVFEKQFKADITWLKANGGKEQSRVQSAMVNIAQHTINSGDWTAINKLFSTNIVYKAKALFYVRALFKGLKYDKKLGLWMKKSKKTTVIIQADLIEIDYTEFSNEGEVTLNYDNLMTNKMIDKIIERVNKSQDDGIKITGDLVALETRIIAVRKALNV